ncbi:hypothetical protein [Actinokineospora sp.]|uniref:hypothetical protein n=1 Tax=Actinokineospora sp. TaxID=1872133 RepID=UPI003D6B7562
MQVEPAVAVQWFIASNAIRVSLLSIADWVTAASCTQCGQPYSTCPSRRVSTS